MKRATIKDVAQHAGVSTTTVSHVVNRTRFVEEATRQRVIEAIAALGYRPNVAARSLTTNRTNTIGVLVADTSNHFFGELLRGIENVAVTAGYSLVVCNTDETLDREEHYLNLLLSQQVDGIIAAAASQRWDAIELADLKHMPIVFVDRTFEGMDNRPYIGVDNKRGAYVGTTHLIEHGYRRIGCLAGFQRLSSMRERLAGFEEAMCDHGLPIRPDWVVTSPLSPEAGREAALQVLYRPDRPEALFINNNFLTLGTLQTLRYLDMHCPRDIALVGFDDHPWASVSDPPLTVVRQPTLEIGEQAATNLLALLDADQLTAPEVVLECELIIRKSCGSHE